MLKMQASFAGSFDLDCQVWSVPHSLSAMVAMILNGPNIKSQGCDGVSQASTSVLPSCSSITSLFVNGREVLLFIIRIQEKHHCQNLVGLVGHARTRKRDLIETLFDLGLSISYD